MPDSPNEPSVVVTQLEVGLIVPDVPSTLLIEDNRHGPGVPVKDLSQDDLRRVGEQWTLDLMLAGVSTPGGGAPEPPA